MAVDVRPVLGDPGTYRRFLSDTAGGILFIVALAVAMPAPLLRDLVFTVLGHWETDTRPEVLSGTELALLGAIVLVAALVVGPLVNVASYVVEHTISLVLRGKLEEKIRDKNLLKKWKRRTLCDLSDISTSDCNISKMIYALRGDWRVISRHFLMITRPDIFASHERYQGIDILCRSALLSSIVVSALAFLHPDTWVPRAVTGAAGAVLFYYFGVLVSYYRHSRHLAALLALAAMTGDRELLDESGRLPEWFERDPGRWYARLMAHYPLRSAGTATS